MAITVHVRDGESIETALKRLKKACDKAEIFQNLKKREFFQKPSVYKHLKTLEVAKKNRQANAKMKELEKQSDKAYILDVL